MGFVIDSLEHLVIRCFGHIGCLSSMAGYAHDALIIIVLISAFQAMIFLPYKGKL
jgi:hypothetical protein